MLVKKINENISSYINKIVYNHIIDYQDLYVYFIKFVYYIYYKNI